MSLTAIYDALAAAISNGRIDLYAAGADPRLAGLRTALAHFGITSSYVLTAARLAQTVSAVVLGGRGEFGVPGALPAELSPVDAVLTCTEPGGDALFALSLSIATAGWTFSRTFPVLPDYQQLDSQNRFVEYLPSFLIGLPLNNAAFASDSRPDAPLRLSGDLPPDGILAQYRALLPGWPLRLSGSVVMPASRDLPPALDLRALAPDVSIAFGSTALRNVGLCLSSATDLDPDLWTVTALSALELVGDVYYTDTSPPLRLSTPLTASSTLWLLQVSLDPGQLRIGDTIVQLAALLGVTPSQLFTPPSLGPLNDFYLADIEVGVDTVPSLTAGVPGIEYIAVTLASDKEWNPPIPFVRVIDVGTRWLVSNLPSELEGSSYTAGSVYGGILIGPKPNPDAADDEPTQSFVIDIEALIPQYVVSGQLRPNDSIPIGTAFRHFFGDPGPSTPADMRVTAMSFQADPFALTVDVAATITVDWAVPLTGNVVFHLVGLDFSVSVSQAEVRGQITGTLLLQGGAPGEEQPRFDVGAEFARSNSTTGWVFVGRLWPQVPLSLNALVFNLLGIDPPQGLPELSVDRMALRFETISTAYAASGAVSARWNPTVFGTTLRLSVAAEASVVRESDAVDPHGTLAGTFSVNRLLLRIGRDIGVADPTYQFRVQFDQLWLTAITSWTEKPTHHQLLTVQLGGVTLGGILEYLVNLAAPTLGFKLDPPWDLLNRIDLSRFALTIDPTYNEVALTYAVDLDIVVMKIRKIGVRYTRKNNQGAVNLILDGDFLGTRYEGDDALSWDVISDPPPAVPGQGTALLDLRYLGAGQHVTLRDIRTLDTVRAVLTRLAEDMRPIEDPDQNPLSQPSGQALVFAPDSEWLLGLDIGLMQTVDLGFIFNDPRLYGLSIALGGERAGALSGLNFEILYKKITNDIGLFRIELRLPEAFRHIELGEVSITLGVVVVEIYTNGNFLIDLGFPYERNFERAFTVQVFPFIGRGGIYFGVLNGATSRRVPAITNGDFSPVLELGIGLAVGVGKEISLGPLSGGIFVEVQAILQGVLAWFNPSSSGSAPAKYYWCQGIAAIHGKLYGKVDFKIIKVMVSLEASAEVSVVFEAYKPSVFRLRVDVRAEAKVKVLFFTISFSFGISLDVSFTVGSERQTPWLLASDQTGRNLAAQSRRGLPPLTRDPQRRSRALRERHFALLRHSQPRLFEIADTVPYVLNWNPQAVVLSAAPRPVAVSLLPNFSVDAIPLSWNGEPPPSGTPAFRGALLLFADDGIAPAARTIAQARLRSAALSAQADDPAELPAALLVEAFLRWAIVAITEPLAAAAAGRDGTVTSISAGQLAVLAEQMDWPQTADGGFAYGNLAEFLSTNIRLQISGQPDGDAVQRGGLAVPLPPALTLDWTGTAGSGQVDLASYNGVGPVYIDGVNRYLAEFFPLAPAPGLPPGDDQPRESFASYLFRDWCLMLTKAAVNAASDLMRAWSYEVTAAGLSLGDIAMSFPRTDVPYRVRSGDTVSSVAAEVGVSAEELIYLNPGIELAIATAPAGSSLSIVLGVAPEIIALDNPDQTLSAGTYALGALDYQLRQADTLNGIATRFGQAGAIALFEDTGLASDRALLRYAASFTAPASSYTPPAGFDRLRVAAVFYVRYYAPLLIPDADWYAATVFQWNADSLSGVGVEQALPVGLGLKVPLALYDVTLPPQANYTTLPGDTLMRIGMALALQQNYADSATAPTPQWPAFRDAVTESGGVVSLPSAPVAILSGETVNSLATRCVLFGASPPDIAGLLAWIGDAPILSDLAVVTLPQVSVDSAVYTNFGAIASNYGLSVAAVGTRLADVAGIFPQNTTLTVAQLPVQHIDTLVAAVLNGPALSDIYGQASRQLLSGLRLPAPVEVGDTIQASGPMTALYTLSGQQFATPAPGEGSAPVLDITVTRDAGADWIVLMDATTLRAGESLADLQARVPVTEVHNASLFAMSARGESVQPGIIVLTAPTDALHYSYSASDLSLLYPPAVLDVTPTQGPEALSLSVAVPRTYGLDHRIELQSPLALAIPVAQCNPAIGSASLWPFPAALAAKAQAQTATPYEIIASGDRQNAAAQPATLLNSTFATAIPFQLRRSGERENVYELLGADTAHRQLLLALWEYLSSGAGAGTQAYLAVQPAPDAGNTSGLAVQAVAPQATYLIKTNLSTDSVPGVEDSHLPAALAARDTPTAVWYADFTELANFLLLLWEGSVVGGAGYYLGFQTTAGAGLPASSFDEQGNVTAYLIAIAATQQSLAPEGRPLLAFNNAALVGAGLDANAQALYVEAADLSDLTAVATVPPGHVGFNLTLPRPEDEHPAGTPPPTAPLFSLLSYQIGPEPGAVFHAARPGLPVTPQASDGMDAPAWQRRRALRRSRALGLATTPPDLNYWNYQQIIPVSRMGPASLAPDVVGLPAAVADPYRGIGGRSSLTQAQVQLGFADLQGNTTAPPANGSNPGLVPVDVGYTDDLISIANWPALSSSYDFGDPVAGNVYLNLRLVLQAGANQPGFAQSPAASLEAQARQAEKYQQVYYQLAQSDLEVSISTSLYQDGNGQPMAVAPAGGREGLWRFAAGAWLLSQSLAALQPVRALQSAAANMHSVVAKYGLDAGLFGSANASLPVRQLLGTAGLNLPAYAVFTEQASARSIAATPRHGWPTPDAAAILNAPQNAEVLPLRLGAVLSTPRVDYHVPPQTINLDEIALQLHSSAGLLASEPANAASTTLLRLGFVFEMEGLSISVGAPIDPAHTLPQDPVVNSFTTLQQAFAVIGINATIADIAAANGARVDMFNAGELLVSYHYLVPPADPPQTLARNASGFDVADLAAANLTTTNLFDAGALVWLGLFTPQPVAAQAETLLDFTARYGSTPGLLLQQLVDDTDFLLPAESVLQVPGMLALPADTAALSVPYTIQPGDQLALIAPHFDLPQNVDAAATILVTRNAAMPGTLLAGQSITVDYDGQEYSTTTVAGDTFASVLARLDQQAAGIGYAELAAAIATQANLLAPGALLSCPLARLDTATTPAALPAHYGVDALSFGQANLALAGLVAANVVLVSPADAPGVQVSISTGENDSLNTVLARFSAAGRELDLADVFKANPDQPLFAAGAKALLPPRSLVLEAAIGAGTGPFRTPVFPLDVSLRLQRPAALVAPAFRRPEQDGPAERAQSSVPAPTSAQGQGADPPQTQSQFAQRFLTVFPQLRLATGKVAGVAADLWVVDFTTDGIASVTVAPGVAAPQGAAFWPRSFALRPLYADLVTRSGIIYAEVKPDGTLRPAEHGRDFQGVDVEVWARRFLGDVDRFLTVPYASGVFADTRARPALARILDAKQKLVGGVAAGLAEILVLDDPKAAAGRAAAVETVSQQLGINLAQAYAAAAVVQYDASVVSAWTGAESGLRPARLYGEARLIDPVSGEVLGRHNGLTSAKTLLDQPSSFVSFVLSVDDPAHQREAELNIDYVYSYIEFDVQDINVGAGPAYQSSNWLNFLPTLSGQARPANLHTRLGTSRIPLPLRAYPAMPALEQQDATAQGASDLAETALWRYSLRYSHEHAAQDEVIVTASFNIPPPPPTLLAAGRTDIAASLARYDSAAASLWPMLSYYDDPASGDAATAANAANSLAELIAAVADDWAAYWQPLDVPAAESPDAVATVPARADYRFSAQLEYSDDGQHIEFLQLTREQDQPGPAGLWPIAVYRSPAGHVVDLGTGSGDGAVRRYAFDPPVPAAAWASISLTWGSLNLASVQNARASLAVVRNRDLNDEAATTEDFVYRSATVDAAAIVTPLNIWPQGIDISALGDTVEAALNATFTTLFGDQRIGQPITMGLYYGYQLVPAPQPDQALATYLPVGLYPNQFLTATTAAEIAAALAAWKNAHRPATVGGEWAFSLVQFSQVDTSAQRSLLELGRLIYRLS
ncbi:MAG: LysM peptidoglycan-binding domain-containing protein [Rhodanobacteraceae bacterium]|nr:LysM peptidoglycan-binding domain-containing protein [Rhodanobacteraceae bacterium]